MAALNAHPGPFLDIGANLGWFTTMVTACTDKITYAIEPFVENFNRILASACENEVPSSRLHAYNIGLDTKFSKCSLYQVPDHNKGDTHSICDEEQKAAFAARNYIELGIMQTAPLDSLYSSGQLGDIPFSLMKIDVEGYELNSILSASAFLSSSIAPQCINIEMDSRRSQEASSWNVDCEAYIGGRRVILRGYGYRHEVLGQPDLQGVLPQIRRENFDVLQAPKMSLESLGPCLRRIEILLQTMHVANTNKQLLHLPPLIPLSSSLPPTTSSSLPPTTSPFSTSCFTTLQTSLFLPPSKTQNQKGLPHALLERILYQLFHLEHVVPAYC
ncbi:hypothetical protein TrCOL_g12478 [Triparma columacea]|uniref:Methyltransferase FkbM domain-containing protein n=1 Tax=Triparma columacea TaxID=722753 RepID=A0A9W7GIW5_9STRA|nr:hypothetical protein TrCOL_g12478 [Triparma columacea]